MYDGHEIHGRMSVVVHTPISCSARRRYALFVYLYDIIKTNSSTEVGQCFCHTSCAIKTSKLINKHLSPRLKKPTHRHYVFENA